jgi:hypothetical protein
MNVHNIPYILVLHKSYHYITNRHVQILGLSHGTDRLPVLREPTAILLIHGSEKIGNH